MSDTVSGVYNVMSKREIIVIGNTYFLLGLTYVNMNMNMNT